jgi:hypothetical protein
MSSIPELPLVAGARLALDAPEGAAREPESALPFVDLSSLPGARVAAREGWTRGPLTLRAVCATAPASGWAPGVEEIIMGRASQIARGALGVTVTSLDAGEIDHTQQVFVQPFSGAAERGADALSLTGRHYLGFAGEPRAAIVCSIACTEPAGAHACAPLIERSGPAGLWQDPPPPSLVVRSILLAAGQPYIALGVLAVIAVVLAALVIARRPLRPRFR